MNRHIQNKASIGSKIRRTADKYGTWLARNPERGKFKQWILAKIFDFTVCDIDPFYGECW